MKEKINHIEINIVLSTSENINVVHKELNKFIAKYGSNQHTHMTVKSHPIDAELEV